MPTTTPRLGLPRPVSADYNNLANMQALIDAIDAAAAVQSTFAAHTHAHSALTGIDTDTATTAVHHTIGGSGTQAAPGNHSHTGLVPGLHGSVHSAGGSDPLVSNAITTPLITDANVTSAKLANGAATGAKLGTDVVVLSGSQTVTGQKRFQQPVVMDQFGSYTTDPGANLTAVYAKSDGNIYRRTSSGEFPLGGAREIVLTAPAWQTQQTPGTWAELSQVSLTGLNWVLAYDGAAEEYAETSVQVPFGYFGLGITAHLTWYAAATTGNVVWRLSTAISGPGGNLSTGFATNTFGTVTDAALGSANAHNRATLTWGSNLPAAGDWLQLRLTRIVGDAGDTMSGDANVLSVAVVFG
jgi:hypothetical protein